MTAQTNLKKRIESGHVLMRVIVVLQEESQKENRKAFTNRTRNVGLRLARISKRE